MKAVRAREFGALEELAAVEVPEPVGGPGQAVVRLRAAALNHRDLRIALNGGFPPPFTLGADGAGELVSGSCRHARVGEAVVINPGLHWGASPRAHSPEFRILGGPGDGTFAEYVQVPAENVYPKPASLDWAEAAAFPLAALTAYRALVTRAEVGPGDTVLILGAGGGVASYNIQLARWLGARVLVTSSEDAKLARARELGAEAGINYRATDWLAAVRELTDGRGPDVIVDSVGAAEWSRTLQAIRTGGRIVFFGSTTGRRGDTEFSLFLQKQVDIRGTYMGSPAEFEAVLMLMRHGVLRSVVDRVFPLDEAPAAFRYLQAGEQFGKVVLDIDMAG
jgi:zinc-binding alcohol dehydrogenase/oxidoreductase